jgi:serine protease Do
MADKLGLPTPAGALVIVVKPNGPAARAHIKANDVILSFGDTPISHARHLLETVIATYPLQHVRAGVWRDRQGIDVDVEFDDQPRDAEATIP